MLSKRHTPASFRDGLKPRPTDVFIAVMGVTGAGKSTFISRCCDKKIAIGHSLQACTSTVDVYPCQISGAITVYLIDTPGFDDTNRSDTEVLREIATWLTDSYTAEIRLSGIIYLHRISDVRMQGSAKKNLFMFKKLCGSNALKNVILATTMWDRVSEAEGVARERELTSTPDFWGWMVSQGSKVYQHAGNKESAFALIKTLMNDKAHITLGLQQQMVNEKKTLDETDAGKEVQAEIIKERERFQKSLDELKQQMEEALQARDEESFQAMKELQDSYNDRMNKLEGSSEKLKVDMEKLHKEKYEKLEARLEESLAQHQKEVQRIVQERERQTAELAREKQVAEKREKEALEALKKLQIKEQPVQITTKGDSRAVVPRSGIRFRCSLAIAGNSFYFRGPTQTVVTWQPSSGVVKNMPNSNHPIMALGEQESWMTIDDDGKADWSNNFGLIYPRLLQSWNKNDFGRVRHIVLGTNAYFFIRGSKHRTWRLTQDAIDHADMHINDKHVSVCALGRNGAYIIQLANGLAFWNLKGCYGGLQDWITKKSKQENKNIMAAALSLTDDSSLMVYEDGDAWLQTEDVYLSSWQEWVMEHFGTSL